MAGAKGQKEQRLMLHLSSANRLLTERAFSGAEGLLCSSGVYSDCNKSHVSVKLTYPAAEDRACPRYCYKPELSLFSWFIERIGSEHTCTDAPPLCLSLLPHLLLPIFFSFSLFETCATVIRGLITLLFSTQDQGRPAGASPPHWAQETSVTAAFWYVHCCAPISCDRN